MPAVKKIKTTKKKTAASPASGKKKSVAARKPSVKHAKQEKKAPVVKTAAPRKSARKAPAGKKAIKKVQAKAGKKPDRLADLRKVLIEKREKIIREAKEEISKYISGENRQLVDTALDEGDWAVVDISEDINLRRLDAHRRALRDIDESLRKLREGTYGICEECGEEIGIKRLGVLPAATLCISCQENKEQLEAFEKEETL